jgi:CHAT domain-containing protein/Tfp pilus assembly protein PilF
LASGFQGGPSAASQATEQEITLLEPGKPTQREIAGGQKHSYRIALTQGEHASVIVEQRGVDVTVKSFGVDGKLIAEQDAENRPTGGERAELVASVTGSYRFDVEPKYPMLPGGRYEIRLEELRVATQNDRSQQEARELYTKAYYSIVAGGYDEAQAMLEKVLEIRQTTIGPDHPDIAFTLTLQANIAYYKGDTARAEPLYQRAIAMLEKTVGPDHPLVATRLNNLGSLYEVKNEIAKSEALHKRALEIREKALAPDHPDIAQSLNNLANVCIDRGDYQRAEPLFLRALAINEKALGPDHLNLSYPLLNLGIVYNQTGDYEKAEQVLLRALSIREKKLDKDHPAVALVLLNLADVYQARGDLDQAEQLYRRALAIQESKFGPDHVNVARSLSGLGEIYCSQGKYPEAESFLQRALAIEKNTLGEDHPDTLSTASKLARLYMANGDYSQAVAFQERAMAGTEHNIDLNLAVGSERQKQAYLASLPEQLNRAISLHVLFAPGSPAARDLAISSLLRRKGRVLDAMSASFAALRSRIDPEHQALLSRLNEITSQLATLVLTGPQRMPASEHQKQIRLLEAEREKLEAEVSDRTAGFYQTQPATLDALRKAIASNAALVEMAVYRPFDPKLDDDHAYGEPRYVVYVVRNQGEVRWKDLGTAKEINKAIDSFRRTLRDPQRRDFLQTSHLLSNKILHPVLDLVGNATHLLISPDGELNLIPFEALVDGQRRYLIEDYSVTYLTTGRDLLRMQVRRSSNGDPLVVADPLFGEPGSKQAAAVSYTKGPSRNVRRSITLGEDFSSVYFAPLPGTAQEARTIQLLFPKARVLTGAQATATALKQVHAPRILHIATHGFFLDDAEASEPPEATPGVKNTRSVHASVKIGNPLLRSGLALAGANLSGSSARNNGILTALEASSLDLWGTKLVTLSACDTGVGEVQYGEGVYGLRRAFFLAGTETLAMSLWPVSDRFTREMMTAYYTGLKRGLGRTEALRQAKLAMLRREDRRHPFYWASFIQAGEWATLDGRK